MNDHDDQTSGALRDALDRAACAFRPEPDLDDVARRRVRRVGRQRNVVVVALLAMLVVAPAAGYAVGRRADDGKIVAGDEGAPALSRDGLRPVETTPVPELGNGGGDSTGTAGTYAPGQWNETPLGRAFVRLAGDAVSLRVYRGALPPQASDTPWAETPGWCFPSGVVYVGASTELAIGAVYGDTYDELRDGEIAATASVVGLTEADPMRVVIAQAPDGTASVEVIFPDGTRDEMAPIDSVAVLAAVADLSIDDDGLFTAPIEVRALDGSGSVLSSAVVTPNSGPGYNTVDLAASGDCPAGGQLPPPGDEQPPDVEAARAAVIDAYRRVHDGSAPSEDRAALLDDPEGFVEITNEILSQFGEPAGGAQLGAIDIVFTTANRAAVSYSVAASSGTFSFVGEAVLTDDGWRMTRDTWCREIELAGKQC